MTYGRQGEDRVMLKEVRLRNRAQSASIARQEVYLLGEGWELDEESIERAELCVSELTGNAIRHAPGPPGSTLRLMLVRRRDRLRIELHDGSRDLPRGVAPDLYGESGRGLFLLACTADDHGIELTPGGKAVWAEIIAWPKDAR